MKGRGLNLEKKPDKKKDQEPHSTFEGLLTDLTFGQTLGPQGDEAPLSSGHKTPLSSTFSDDEDTKETSIDAADPFEGAFEEKSLPPLELGSPDDQPRLPPTFAENLAPEPPGLSDNLQGEWDAPLPLELGEPLPLFSPGENPLEFQQVDSGSQKDFDPLAPDFGDNSGDKALELGDPFADLKSSLAQMDSVGSDGPSGLHKANGFGDADPPMEPGLGVEDPFANAQFDFRTGNTHSKSKSVMLPPPLPLDDTPFAPDGGLPLGQQDPLDPPHQNDAPSGNGLVGENFPTLTLFQGGGQEERTQMVETQHPEGGDEGTILSLMAPATSPPAMAFAQEDHSATILKEMAQAEVERSKKKNRKKKSGAQRALDLPPPLAAKVSKSKTNKRLPLLLAGLVFSGLFFTASTYWEELNPFFKDQLIEFGIVSRPVAEVTPPPPKKPEGPKPNESTPGATGAKAIRAPTTQADGAIVAHFAKAEDALDGADVSQVVQVLNAELPKPLTDAADLLLAASYAARYYLMVGNSKKAQDLLANGCQSPTDVNSQACLHYLRALVARGQHGKAQKYLQWLKDQGPDSSWNQIYHKEIEFMELANKALQSPNFKNVKALTNNVLLEPLLRSEWSRHRSGWLAQSVFALPMKDRKAFAQYTHEERKNDFLKLFERTDTPWSNGNEPILMPFLLLMAQEFELPAYGSKPIPVKLGSRGHSVARVLEAAGRSVLEPNELALVGLDTLDAKDPNSIVAKILAANLALMDGSLAKSHKLINELVAIPYKGGFVESIVLLQMRYGLQARNGPYIQRVMGGTNKGLVQRLFQGSFEGAITQLRVNRLLQKPDRGALALAKQKAVTPRELGLVAVEEAHMLKQKGDLKKAVSLLRKEAKKYPGHATLLTTYAEFIGIIGKDPTRALEALEGPKKTPLPNELAVRSLEFAVIPEGAWKSVFKEL